jgi:Ca2+-binding RTX toxin-like protein
LLGGGSRDFVIGGTGNDSLLGQDGDDVLRGNAGSDMIDGGFGNDLLIEDGNSFTLINDRLFGSDGTDTLASIETVSLSSFSDGSVIDASGFTDGSVSLQSQSGSSVLVDGIRDDTLEGGLSADVDLLFGGDGNDALSGGSGNDVLDGGLGKDRLRGGFGESIGVGNIEFDTSFGGANADDLPFW